MKTTTVNLELTTDELFDIAYALEEYVKNSVKHPYVRNAKYLLEMECKSETDLLQHFINYHGYTLSIYPDPFAMTKEYYHVDEWVKELMRKESKDRKKKAKEEVI